MLGEPVRAEHLAPGEPLAWRTLWPRLVGDTAAWHGRGGEQRPWRELLVHRADLVAAVGDRPLAGTGGPLRIAAWRPRLGFETYLTAPSHEVDGRRTAVHLHKGGHRGQETVARVHNLGRPPRRLVFLHLDASVTRRRAR